MFAWNSVPRRILPVLGWGHRSVLSIITDRLSYSVVDCRQLSFSCRFSVLSCQERTTTSHHVFTVSSTTFPAVISRLSTFQPFLSRLFVVPVKWLVSLLGDTFCYVFIFIRCTFLFTNCQLLCSWVHQRICHMFASVPKQYKLVLVVEHIGDPRPECTNDASETFRFIQPAVSTVWDSEMHHIDCWHFLWFHSIWVEYRSHIRHSGVQLVAGCHSCNPVHRAFSRDISYSARLMLLFVGSHWLASVQLNTIYYDNLAVTYFIGPPCILGNAVYKGIS